MTRSQNNVYEMAKRVLRVLNENPSAWEKYPFLVSRRAQLEERVADILKQDKHTASLQEGWTVKKQDAKQELLNALYKIRSALKVHASVDNRSDLLDIIKGYRITRKMKDVDLQVNAEVLIDLATQYDLTDYGITEDFVQQVVSLAKAFENLYERPLGMIHNINNSKRLVRKEVQQVMRMFQKEIDPMMVQFVGTNDSFYQLYQYARTVIDRKASYSSTPAEEPGVDNTANGTETAG